RQSKRSTLENGANCQRPTTHLFLHPKPDRLRNQIKSLTPRALNRNSIRKRKFSLLDGLGNSRASTPARSAFRQFLRWLAAIWPTRSSVFRFHAIRSEEHTSELQSRFELVCRLLLEKKNTTLLSILSQLFHFSLSPYLY